MNNLPIPAQLARTGDPVFLREALQRTRQRTLDLLGDYVDFLGEACAVPCRPELNPPLWELCHVAWFQDWWLARNPDWSLGLACQPDRPRLESRLPDADARLNSSVIAHQRRWEIGLPDLQGTRTFLDESLKDTLELLGQAGQLCLRQPDQSDQYLYFFRLCLFHEQMHNEAAVFMANQLGIPLSEPLGRKALQHDGPLGRLQLPATQWTLGWQGPGFAFDNELPAHTVQIPAFEIDPQAVTWAQYLQFVDDTWHTLPPGVEYRNGLWMHNTFGQQRPLNLRAPAEHVSWDDAQAYCQWAGCRLPTEAEWDCAVHTHPAMQWGQVWEWTSDTFLPFDGFVPHPYVDYSQPWFKDRKVLKGASWATSAEMVHPVYRNYFQPDRRDVLSGFRTCLSTSSEFTGI